MYSRPAIQRWSRRRIGATVLAVSAVVWLVVQIVSSGSSSSADSLASAVHAQRALYAPACPPLDESTPALLARVASVCIPQAHECSRPVSWEELGSIITMDQSHMIGRLRPVQSAYMAARAAMAAEYRSVSDSVREKKFGAPCILNAQGKKECEFSAELLAADASSLASSGPEADLWTVPLPTSVLVPNDFSYALAPPISHDLIWLRFPLARTDPRILRLVEHYFPRQHWQTMHLVNPPHLQTIRDIFHIHVFARSWKEKERAEAAAAAEKEQEMEQQAAR